MDRVEFADLVGEYQARLRQFLRTKVANQADIEDLLQDVLIKTYNKLDTLEDTERLGSWLFQVAHRTVIDFYRKRAREQAGELPEDLVNPSADDAAIEQELALCIEPMMAALPTEQAALLRSIDLHGQSQKQLAEQTGVSYSTLKSRVQTARGALRQVFEQCCYFSVDRDGKVIDYTAKAKDCKNC
ncbi:MAG: RNA polymerase sigma factor SigZ [Pseudomonadota bacterium]